MKHNARICCLLALTLIGLNGCSSETSAKAAKKSGPPLDRIQGKAQVVDESGATDAALNAGGLPFTCGKGRGATAFS